MIQALQKEKKMWTMSLDLLTETEISLSKEEYNATKSKIEFQLEAFDEKKWTQMRDNMPLSIVSKFHTIDFLMHKVCNIKIQYYCK